MGKVTTPLTIINRAEQEQQRAEREKQRADSAELEIARLKALLRQSGMEIDDNDT